MWLLTQVALALCPVDPVATLTCGSSISGQLDPGVWTGNAPPGACDPAFDALDSTLGATDCAPNAPSLCNSLPQFAGWVCNTGPSYACGVTAFGEGPEDIYEVVCPQDGALTLSLGAIDCDLDLYLLPDSCQPDSCVFGSTNAALSTEGGTVSCVPGNTYYVVVEGYGFTQGGYSDGAAAYCDTHLASPAGSYTLDVSCVPDTTPENCIQVGDEDGDGLEDCADPDCFAAPFCCDDDGDGFEDVVCGGGDCDDATFDPPSADGDADGTLDACDVCPVDADPGQEDTDGDGVGDVCEVCPGVDDASDGDQDGVPCADDCDDADPDRYPGNSEQCDGIDNDCDGTIDEEVVTTDYWPDLDGDGHGDPNGTPVSTCMGAPAGTAAAADDCDDSSNTSFPGAHELADGRDNDCDGTVDEGTERYDDDGDGFTELGGDCDDADPLRAPGVPESCDGVDQDCDGVPDDGTPCADDDGDGFCEGPLCTTGTPGDCHDGDPAVYPSATEVPGNGVDDDCDGTVDLPTTDADGDGFAVEGGDCDDQDPAIHPGAVELQNGIDDDCDGTTDEGTFVYDDDGDGASEQGGDCDDQDPAVSPAADEIENGRDDDCDGAIDEDTNAGDDDGDGFTENGGDCDDDDDDRNPGARETANGIDDDCDGAIDEGLADRDRDGYATDDCNDDDGFVNPGATEICDLVDNDCDGTVDEGCDETETPLPDETGGCQTAPSWFGLRWWRR